MTSLLFGDSGPFFALVGVSLASGTGILTKDDELEGVCWEIREAISKIKWADVGCDTYEKRCENESITLNNLELGAPIGKGCSAAIYAAKLKDDHSSTSGDQEVVIEIKDTNESGQNINDFPLALKMMFNYDIQSNALAILKAMYCETIPARQYYNSELDWERTLAERRPCLPPHPNIVAMYSVFADYVPNLTDSFTLYPAALPRHINPEGLGRNMSLFLLMKRYDCTLNEYLKNHEVNNRVSLLLFTQLLEAVTHINLYGVAHRDLKSDNILLDLNEEDAAPILVLTDFGWCLADSVNGLQLPYNSMEIIKGGNTALMAPEVMQQTPGLFSVINYEKSDLWAVGTIAYEIFGMENPFYTTDKQTNSKLESTQYNQSDLPDLPEDVPVVVRNLIKNILAKNPNKRVNCEIAANICQLYLWAPSSWFKNGIIKMPSSTEILQWLLCLTTKILCESRLSNVKNNYFRYNEKTNFKTGRRTYPEYLLISTFLQRVRLSQIRTAIAWIHKHLE